jgi:hypothetical protein
MYFVMKLPKTRRGNDAIWVIVDRLTKSAHFLAIKETFNLERLAQLYVDGSFRSTKRRCLSFQIVIVGLHLTFGKVFNGPWEEN